MLRIFSKNYSNIGKFSKLILDIFFLTWKNLRIILGFGSCKFIPSCSRYTIEAIKKYGWIKGLYLSSIRVLRCNPFSKGGYDPVP